MEQATELYRSCIITDKQIAIEKLWDAFERLKTYYYGSVNDKKSSITKIVNNISNGNPKYKELFDKEFNELTVIGNSYRIRHHKMDKIEVIDNDYYDYLFQQCPALINLALKYLK